MTTQPKISQAARQAAEELEKGIMPWKVNREAVEKLIQSAIDAETAQLFDRIYVEREQFKKSEQTVARLLSEVCQLRAAAEDYRKALEEIEKGEGPFSRDQLTFATNVIERSKQIARAILAKHAPNSAQ